MPKRNKLPVVPDFNGAGLHPEKSWVQKSKPFQSLSETDLTLPELKILDAYLARINSHEPSKRTVRFEKGELETILGVVKIPQSELDKRLKGLFSVVKITDESKRRGFKLVSLFEEADAEPDKNGLWQITLTCTQKAREYIFNVDSIGYLRYRLKNVINLTSRYSYVLFQYLLDNRFRNCWQIPLDELKQMLRCNASTYEQYYRFNDLVLKKAHKELNEKTDIRFDYTAVKKGRTVVAVEFTIISVYNELTAEDENQMTLDDSFFADEKTVTKDYGGGLNDLLGSDCQNAFTPEEVQVICDLVRERLPNDDDLKRSRFCQSVYNKLLLAESRNKITSRFNYFCTMIRKEKI